MLLLSTLLVLPLLLSVVASSYYYISIALLLSLICSLLPSVQGLGIHLLGGVSSWWTWDETSSLLIYITTLVLFLAFYSYDFTPTPHPPLLIFFLLFISSYFVFSTSSLFLLYLFYEASLVPITFAIINWGAYSDRSASALMILLFTSVFTFPLTLIILSSFLSSASFLTFSLVTSEPLPTFLSLWILLSFAVKLPVYGLHYWLPIAHVEAPTFGSMILAGLLLNMGGCGLIRFLPLLTPSLPAISSYFLSYAIVSVVASSLLTAHQSDINRLVAYSSVVHMTLILLLILHPVTLSLKAVLMLMVFHGLSSPLLFYLVGVVYTTCGTRLIYLTRGLLLTSPLIALMSTLSLAVSVPIPPTTPFVSEVLLFLSIYPLSAWLSLAILSSLLLVLLYNLLWYMGLTFDPSSSTLSLPTIFQSLILFLFLLPLVLFVFVLFLF